jgi:succinate dehydrogenase/fumarate reductase flavoprotein subunit
MTAVSRWMYTAALARTESRGMHKRLDLPGQDAAQHHRLLVGGLDRPWVRVQPLSWSAPLAVAS